MGSDTNMIVKMPDEARIELAKTVQKLRLQKNCTQAELSRQTGVSLSVIRKFEQTGKISVASLLKLGFNLGFLESLLEGVNRHVRQPGAMDELLRKSGQKKRRRASTS